MPAYAIYRCLINAKYSNDILTYTDANTPFYFMYALYTHTKQIFGLYYRLAWMCVRSFFCAILQATSLDSCFSLSRFDSIPSKVAIYNPKYNFSLCLSRVVDWCSCNNETWIVCYCFMALRMSVCQKIESSVTMSSRLFHAIFVSFSLSRISHDFSVMQSQIPLSQAYMN